METFKLKVVGFHQTFYDAPALQLQLPTIDGSRGILAHHEAAVIGIIPGTLRIQKEDGSWITAVTDDGFARVKGDTVDVLVEEIVLPEEIDEIKVQKELDTAKEELRQKHTAREYQHAEASIQRALARLKMKDI